MSYINRILFFVVLVSLTASIQAQNSNIKTLSNDGAWCWFSAPGAIYRHNNANEVISGWVKADGSIETAILNLDTDSISSQIISPQLDKDDHANPAFIELANKEVLIFYAKHFDRAIRVNRLPAGSEKANFGEMDFKEVYNVEQFKLYPKKVVTYANPIALSEENNRLFCFGRWTGYKPNMMWSDDNGVTFNPAQVFITNKPFDDVNRPYVKYYSNGKSKIHIIFTDGHPRKEPTNSVYYAYYENGEFWRVDGSKICNLEEIPFEPKEASMVYKADEKSGLAWVFDVSEDENENPVILYARYPTTKDHLYHYATYSNGAWEDYKICHAGKWFPETPEGGYEREPHYSGGMVIHPRETNTIYLSREVNGVFEIEKRTTSDKGKTWSISPITQNSINNNVRPIVANNMNKTDKMVVLWMENEKYIHFTDYKTKIKYITEY